WPGRSTSGRPLRRCCAAPAGTCGILRRRNVAGAASIFHAAPPTIGTAGAGPPGRPARPMLVTPLGGDLGQGGACGSSGRDRAGGAVQYRPLTVARRNGPPSLGFSSSRPGSPPRCPAGAGVNQDVA